MSETSLFSLEQAYPDARSLFSADWKPISKIKDDCVFVLDANVLLLPYMTSKKTLDEVEATYTYFIKQDRLLVPERCVREFVKNRSGKLTELHQLLCNQKSKVAKVKLESSPLLLQLPEYENVRNSENALDEAIVKYQESIDGIIERVRSWTWNDPVSSLYRKIFPENVIWQLSTKSPDELKSELQSSLCNLIPPGYKDGAKPDSGIGDLIIWNTILEIGSTRRCHLVFVSGEEKSDWWHRSNNTALYPRFELVDQYRIASGGKSFHIMKLHEVMELFGKGSNAIAEIRQRELDDRIAPPSELEAEIAVERWVREFFKPVYIEARATGFPDLRFGDVSGESRSIEIVRYHERTSLYKIIYTKSNMARDLGIKNFAFAIVSIRGNSKRIIEPLRTKNLTYPCYIGHLDAGGRFILDHFVSPSQEEILP